MRGGECGWGSVSEGQQIEGHKKGEHDQEQEEGHAPIVEEVVLEVVSVGDMPHEPLLDHFLADLNGLGARHSIA